VNRRPNNAAAWNARISLGLFLLGAIAAAGAQTGAPDSTHNQAAAQPAVAQNSQADSKKAPDAPATTTPATVNPDPHQAQIIADSQKLLKLSQELKAEVAKSNKDTLSLTVIKKAEEVEKLAKTLKEEMNKSR